MLLLSFQTILQAHNRQKQGTFGIPSKQSTLGLPSHGGPSRAHMKAANDKENNGQTTSTTARLPHKHTTEKKEKKKEGKS